MIRYMLHLSLYFLLLLVVACNNNPAAPGLKGLTETLSEKIASGEVDTADSAVKQILIADDIVPTSPYVDTSIPPVGKSAHDDGSAKRLLLYGQDQYFQGNLGDGNVPLVKISHAVTDEVVDVQVVFNPAFVDLSYGKTGLGWANRTFRHVVTSDHVQLSFLNGDQQVVLEAKFDLISATHLTQSGYAALGVSGGDGALLQGNKEDILSFGTSMDDNINYYGYGPLENSPEVDSLYHPLPPYENWQFYVVYRVSLSRDAFGASGYGKVAMTSVHASPAKNGPETVVVTEMQTPPTADQNPFTHFSGLRPNADQPISEPTDSDTTHTPDPDPVDSDTTTTEDPIYL